MKKCTSFEKQKCTRYIRKNVYFGIMFSCLSFKLFKRQDILAKNQNFKKLRYSFVDERALITTAIISSCHWKTLTLFCLQKKRPENAFLILIVYYRKIVQKNKFEATANYLFNDMCYKDIGSFDWKISVFQQTIVRGLLHPLVKLKTWN